jgi:hypothetical protein
MKLSEALAAYYEVSGKASDVARSLAIAGLAVVWIFKVGDGQDAKPAADFILPAALLVIALAADLLQYLAASIVWGTFHRRQEKKLIPKYEDKAPEMPVEARPWFNWIGLLFYSIKMLAVISAYGVLIRILVHRWMHSGAL